MYNNKKTSDLPALTINRLGKFATFQKMSELAGDYLPLIKVFFPVHVIYYTKIMMDFNGADNC